MTIPTIERSAAARRRPARSSALLPPRDGWIAIAGVAVIYAAHWFYGALLSEPAMVMNIAAALLVAGTLLSPRLRDDVLRLKGLTAPAILFALVIAVALWTLTPWTPGGPHPVWAYVGEGPGASTIDKSATSVEIIKLLGLGCLFVVGLATGARDERARYAVQLTIAAGVLFGLWAFLAFVSGGIDQPRLAAHFLSPNTAGTVFAILLLLGITELLRSFRSGDRASRLNRSLPLGAACLTFLVCLLDSASRSAASALLIAGLVYIAAQLACGRLKLSRALAGVLLAILALLGVIAFAGDQLIDRLFQSHEAAVTRTEIWRIHWQAFLGSPLFGYGLGSIETIDKTLITAANFDVLWSIRSVHNIYLQWLEQAGVVGAAPMFLCIAAIIIATIRGVLRRSRMTGTLAGLLAVDAIILVHGLTDFGLEVPSLAGMWAWLLGLQFALAQGSSRR